MKVLKIQLKCIYSFNTLVPVRESRNKIFISIFITGGKPPTRNSSPIVDHRGEDTYLSLTCGRLCADTGSSSTAARAGQSVKRRPGFQPRSHPSAGWALKEEMQGILGVPHWPSKTLNASFNNPLSLSSLTLETVVHSKLL